MKITEPTPGAPCWVDLATSDPSAARALYTELFGWRAEGELSAEGGGYLRLLLGDNAVGGLSGRQAGQPVAWAVYFATDSVDEAAARVAAAGGRVVRGPGDAHGGVRFAAVADPSGAGFALWQAGESTPETVFNEPGALGWAELATRDTEGSIAFYHEVLGWSVSSTEMYTQFGVDGWDFGGMADMTEQFPEDVPPYWMPYFAVADVDTTAERAVGLGAGVLLPPTDVPDGPRLAVLRDAQGARFGIHRPE